MVASGMKKMYMFGINKQGHYEILYYIIIIYIISSQYNRTDPWM